MNEVKQQSIYEAVLSNFGRTLVVFVLITVESQLTLNPHYTPLYSNSKSKER